MLEAQADLHWSHMTNRFCHDATRGDNYVRQHENMHKNSAQQKESRTVHLL